MYKPGSSILVALLVVASTGAVMTQTSCGATLIEFYLKFTTHLLSWVKPYNNGPSGPGNQTFCQAFENTIFTPKGDYVISPVQLALALRNGQMSCSNCQKLDSILPAQVSMTDLHESNELFTINKFENRSGNTLVEELHYMKPGISWSCREYVSNVYRFKMTHCNYSTTASTNANDRSISFIMVKPAQQEAPQPSAKKSVEDLALLFRQQPTVYVSALTDVSNNAPVYGLRPPTMNIDSISSMAFHSNDNCTYRNNGVEHHKFEVEEMINMNIGNDNLNFFAVVGIRTGTTNNQYTPSINVSVTAEPFLFFIQLGNYMVIRGQIAN